MADTKISDLAAVTDVQDTDEFVLARAGTTNKIDGVDLRAELGGGAWASYTPVLTASSSNPTLGTGSSVAGRWISLGGLGIVQAKIVFGSSGVSVGSGNYEISLPFTVGANQLTFCGNGMAYDSDLFDSYTLVCSPLVGQTKTQLFMAATATAGAVTHAAPFGWAANDQLHASFIGEIA